LQGKHSLTTNWILWPDERLGVRYLSLKLSSGWQAELINDTTDELRVFWCDPLSDMLHTSGLELQPPYPLDALIGWCFDAGTILHCARQRGNRGRTLYRVSRVSLLTLRKTKIKKPSVLLSWLIGIHILGHSRADKIKCIVSQIQPARCSPRA
jgi:hypothetical protein